MSVDSIPITLYFDRKSLNSSHKPLGGAGGASRFEIGSPSFISLVGATEALKCC